MSLSLENISKMINISLASLKIKKIILPSGHELRSQIHLLMQGSIGSGKSSLLFQVAKHLKVLPQISITKPTLLGSFDKTTGLMTPPTVWRMRNKMLLVDEIHFSPKDYALRDVVDILLQLMEYPEYEKPIGYRCNPFVDPENTEEMFCIVKDNIIHCKTRFVFFGNTMYNLKGTDLVEMQAFISRCIVLPYYPSTEELKVRIQGKPMFTYKEIKIKEEIVKISKQTEKKILAFLDRKHVKPSRYMRLYGDLCRVVAVEGKINEETFELISELVDAQEKILEEKIIKEKVNEIGGCEEWKTEK